MTEEHLFRQHALQILLSLMKIFLRDGLEDNGHVIEIKPEVSDGEANKFGLIVSESLKPFSSSI